MFDMLIETKSKLQELLPLSNNEIRWIQQVLLYSGAERTIPCDEVGAIDASRQDSIRHAFSFLVGVSTQLTQEELYKNNFLQTLQRIALS